ncbi:right-handed parallel beta-helix repeat-containing protein [Paenibacillus mucilaginosus]|uniref:Parallel beta-helix repeat-containing protein n=1 Tax=Paenibacillus mucilaginosus (strain KNP414) TaxID=1036673 RepID=F8FQ92_PAEMK|nr:right-handed parallel beta-helix repeat-containing protein [Paenibacillus mucilaginosus]AEI40312.1 parallel beta-helix repeat-containing protein [Paenibacillus mucilaginosus KNP414]MCG7213329.1 right-handed parallel beta-helix repeat-containing protein [Paenibacillus mucilaginosus]WDM29518.1 right-handed parallel beta-helix repeat-containing protein [Paenibacillus mucilaginosus]
MNTGVTRKKSTRLLGLSLSLVVLCSSFVWEESVQAAGKTYYVDIDTGIDRSDYGLTADKPFKNIQYAANLTNPGDTVYVMDGTYYKTNDQDVFHVTRSGDSTSTGGYINYLAYPGHRPKLKAIDAWNHIVVNASYIKIEGFEIEGDNANLTLADGEARYNHFVQNQPTNTVDWAYIRKTQTNGINIKPATGTTVNPHHVIIKNNIVHDTPGGGIGADESDYITIENNTVYNTSWYNLYATSGISVFHSVDKDTNTTTYKNLIRNNRVYNNMTLVKWGKTKDYSDGNGIIIDDNQNSQLNGKYPAYKGKTLVTNNLAYNNGGSGIHSYFSHNVDIINNTAYQNNSRLDEGEIYANSTNNVKILNNILVGRTGKKINSNYNNTNLTYDYNVYSNGNPVVSGTNDIWADPLFLNAAGGDFRLKIGSRAIDVGTTTLAPSNDFQYNPRPRGANPDRGALESQNLIGNPSFEWTNLNGGWTKELNSAGITAQNSGAYSGTYKAAFSTTAATKMSQTVTAPTTKTYTVTAYINTNIESNVKLGADVGGVNKGQQSVASGAYQKVTFTVSATAGQAIKVWISAPQSAGGWVAIDDVSVE